VQLTSKWHFSLVAGRVVKQAGSSKLLAKLNAPMPGGANTCIVTTTSRAMRVSSMHDFVVDCGGHAPCTKMPRPSASVTTEICRLGRLLMHGSRQHVIQDSRLHDKLAVKGLRL
jgi:hypothetical protein